MVRWNATSKTLGPASEGIESRALPGWDGAMSLGPDNPTLQPIADWMTSTFGYKQGVDVVAQPYGEWLGKLPFVATFLFLFRPPLTCALLRWRAAPLKTGGQAPRPG